MILEKIISKDYSNNLELCEIKYKNEEINIYLTDLDKNLEIKINFIAPQLFLHAREGSRNEFEKSQGMIPGQFIFRVDKSISGDDIRKLSHNNLQFQDGDYFVAHYCIIIPNDIIEVFCENRPEITHRNI